MNKFRLIFTGDISKGVDVALVKNKLMFLLKVNEDKIEELFVNCPVTIKNNLDYDSAIKYKAVFDATGAICSIERAYSIIAKFNPVYLTLEIVGSIIVFLGLAEALANTNFVPAHLQFDNYGWYMIGFGTLMGLPLLIELIKQPKLLKNESNVIS